ncbi:MAG: helix-turn-helix domain-containing protein [Clostridia bacterium]|nr:helix-turn-helix domain-containing protein [Clostridia bacterium]
MTQEQIKNNFSKNLSNLRKSTGLTQLALAEKLNYSDKAVSKWEVGSVVPDVETMTHIAEFFGVTVNDLIYPEKKKFNNTFWKNHILITLLSVGLVWFLSTIVFFILQQTTPLSRVWLTFIIAIPISSIVLIVFSAIWFNKIFLTLSVSALYWSIILNIYLFINQPALWFIFIIGVVGQLLIIFWSQLKKIVIPKKHK